MKGKQFGSNSSDFSLAFALGFIPKLQNSLIKNKTYHMVFKKFKGVPYKAIFKRY
jgi:hypothetical protein